MYSPSPMEDESHKPDVEQLERQVGELESLTDSLGDVPDEEVVEALGRAVELLREINTGIESGLRSAREGARDVNEVLERVNLGRFDEALERLEAEERGDDEPGD